ncbi:sporulation integral membrane protein YlbJ [Virgibacillus alimentarius]|uniref:Sporulation integral membrane protein YlbJ n=1 Tax=Virgibacillus alimentarius TaxID=698769 RepID=A0ABS4S3N1_9BACI|nr:MULTISPECIES: sporulation integral membrane protein YlbJ [Virgibacillus]MBP2256095.1 sporulation integral membrane protein YlbJ [Virgibacillus alimentarius]HLR66042.1 sporulation integral membrane protein YlbJ [Virgibacillus sp.]
MRQIIKTISLASITIFFTSSLIIFPDQAFEASIRGLNMWLEIVFPSLLPFFIAAELLIGFGVVKFLGVLFEPIMRPLFNVPGAGGFAWVMGMASGYPSGAKISVRLREKNQLSQIEAERLLSFTNASSPLFIFGALSIGFLHDAKLGIVLAVSHYLGNALVGICMRFYGKTTKENKEVKQKSYFIRAFKEMHKTRLEDTRPFGKVVGDAVVHSIQTLVMIGGFIILFSVFTKLLFLIGLSPIIAKVFKVLLVILGLPADLALPFFSGLFEITLGAQMISQLATDGVLAKIVIISFILGFNGFSVQAQVASIIAKTDIRFAPYFFARLLHGLFASILCILLFKPLYLNRQAFEREDIPVLQDVHENNWQIALDILKQIGPVVTIFFLGVAGFLLYKRQLKTK